LLRIPAATISPKTSFFFLVGYFFILVLVTLFVHLREFEGFGCDHFELGPAFIADDNIAFFNFVGIEIENAFAFLTNWHTSLLSRSIKMFTVAATHRRLG
jgi:hypothetical protein